MGVEGIFFGVDTNGRVLGFRTEHLGDDVPPGATVFYEDGDLPELDLGEACVFSREASGEPYLFDDGTGELSVDALPPEVRALVGRVRFVGDAELVDEIWPDQLEGDEVEESEDSEPEPEPLAASQWSPTDDDRPDLHRYWASAGSRLLTGKTGYGVPLEHLMPRRDPALVTGYLRAMDAAFDALPAAHQRLVEVTLVSPTADATPVHRQLAELGITQAQLLQGRTEVDAAFVRAAKAWLATVT